MPTTGTTSPTVSTRQPTAVSLAQPTPIATEAGDAAAEPIARPGGELANTEWILRTLNGKALIPGSKITLHLMVDGLTGFAGCNYYGGEYVAEKGGVLRLPEPPSSNQMLCRHESINRQEGAYINALGQSATYRVHDGRLHIRDMNGDTRLVFAKKPSIDLGDIRDVRWVLFSLRGREPVRGMTATLSFYANGYLAGKVGCYSYEANFSRRGTDLVIREPGINKYGSECDGLPEDVRRQQAAYLDALADIASYRIRADRLEIQAASGETIMVLALGRPPFIDPALAETEWVLRSLYGKSPLRDSVITLVFADDGLGGESGCNFYGGKYIAASGGKLEVVELAGTARGCVEPILEQEEAYTRALSQATAYRVAGDRLELKDAAGKAILVFNRK